MNMKFIRGMMIGGIVSTGLIMLYNEEMSKNGTKKMIKKGKQFLRKMM